MKFALEDERTTLLREPDEVPELPSIEVLKEKAREVVGQTDFADPAFGREMRVLLPRIEVFPFRSLDGGPVVLRARLTVNLASLLGTSDVAVGDLLCRTVWVDLFDAPQPVAFRERMVALLAAGRTARAAAQELGLTVTAGHRALALHRMMAQAGTTDPYQPVSTPPDDLGRMRRHKHPRYCFSPLDGYPAWPEESGTAAA
jgi:hypothetical protein